MFFSFVIVEWNQMKFISFKDGTTYQEISQCPLVETDIIISLFIVYRYDSTTETFTVPPGGD